MLSVIIRGFHGWLFLQSDLISVVFFSWTSKLFENVKLLLSLLTVLQNIDFATGWRTSSFFSSSRCDRRHVTSVRSSSCLYTMRMELNKGLILWQPDADAGCQENQIAYKGCFRVKQSPQGPVVWIDWFNFRERMCVTFPLTMRTFPKSRLCQEPKKS